MPVSSPLSRPADLVLHIGSGKTGTSSIQTFLHQNRANLADLGILYPRSPGNTRHNRLGLYVQTDDVLHRSRGWRRERFSSPRAFRRAFRRRLFGEINASGLSRVLLSDEALYGSPDQALRRLNRFVDRIAGSLRLVVYLRRQDDHLVSRYQQVVKMGETRRLAEQTPQAGAPQRGTSWAAHQGSRTYDYYDRLRTWERLLQPDEFVVRRFERDRFVDGSLHQDFLDAAGVDARASRMEHSRPWNESMDAESVEFLRILNMLRAENEAAATLVANDRPLRKRLAAASTGPTLTLPAGYLDAFMARWADSNTRVAQEFLGEESGQLFDRPRKTRDTTTEQYFDPARLDHFIALLELPEQTHAPLRYLVDREAKGR
jgi:hypothetical protein